ncbi:2-amino-4-hydroxy-6-hydroxymethyldihydropteridine diphosphokinase [Hymenobacter negativus]|uniref:2-amino-4-hydroxy-6-hydroxymethyldihydropteridine pyrophosphokinase n=1 Tax=Hymenobacter negativus TaxID=2795026 RepID=A0ABS0Q5Q3_9BACT|nr:MULTISPECIES: 2-amino-4-hydroxy-6-hydroxymethyldihydropteridine diphosphokinase [Bacteria]MBH8557974.1 2-amino-4-hydroxy-6-hydroxymethyldihydropteridine diphosphokinase [Hymenobacter negativus]MBH8567483.1 2-amino-4-hydroxy-6-hydroxymethyldihydropteridine diphosphokinase [Hymenobacter negativus]MBR7207215.1 2-amino-4-hydroxy-6-hydroxymethyldihydropteridine diphosphokinase [Microvirga sp. STS02]
MSREPVLAYLLLGSNLGDRAALLAQARTRLAATAGAIVAESGIYETAAWGREDQPAFLNQALAVRTGLSAEELLAACLNTEQAAGRERHEHWGSRTLDVDILFYGPEIIATPALSVPHPRLAERRFALVPLAEIAGSLLHPQLNETVAALLARCPDPLPVRRWPGE